ncbi:unnamed protein product [Boreogadus saida]
MPVLRKWWCTVLLENFHLDGHGRRFPHFMEEAKQMAAGLLPPVFRLKRKRESRQLVVLIAAREGRTVFHVWMVVKSFCVLSHRTRIEGRRRGSARPAQETGGEEGGEWECGEVNE